MKKNIPVLILSSILLILNVAVNAQKSGKSELIATIAGISNGNISKDMLLSSATLKCSDPIYEIIYFSFSVLRKNGDLIVYSGNGNTFTESMKAELKEMETGAKLILEDIGAKSSDVKIIKLPSIVLVLN